MTDVIAQMEALLASLPKQMPTELRIGPGVMAVLRRIADKPAGPYGMHSLGALAGVRVVEHPDCGAGDWRMVDQHGAEMQAGNVYELGTAPNPPCPEGCGKPASGPDGAPCTACGAAIMSEPGPPEPLDADPSADEMWR